MEFTNLHPLYKKLIIHICLVGVLLSTTCFGSWEPISGESQANRLQGLLVYYNEWVESV
jgi:hypothetical protein